MEKKKKTNNTLIVCITIFLCVATISGFYYMNKMNEQRAEQEKLEREEEDRSYYRRRLNSCIEEAKENRTNLWQANCPKNNPDCSLNNSTVKWIDERYEQEVKECNMKYKY